MRRWQDAVESTPLLFGEDSCFTQNPGMGREGVAVVKGRHASISQILQKGRLSQRLVGRVSRMWKTYNPKRPGDLMSLDFVVIDEKVDCICCSVKTRYIHEFEPLLEVGKVYVFKNYFVTEVKPDYHILHDRLFYLDFDSSSSIDELVTNIPAIPLHKFSIVPYENLATVGYNRINLCDVIGVATSVSDVGERVCKDVITKVQNVELTDLRGEILKVTVWGEDCTRQALLLADSPRRIWIITSTIVKYDLKGNLFVSTSSASKFYNCDDIDEIRSFAYGLSGEAVAPELILTKMYSPYIMRSEFEKWYRTNIQVQEMIAVGNKFENPLFIRGAITSIGEHNGWRYNSCNGCRKKVKFVDDRYYCGNCNKDEPKPALRYRIEFVVDDGNASVDCVMFDREVDKVVPIKCPDLAYQTSQEDYDEVIPRPIMRIVGKSYIFKLRYNEYGRDYQRDSFTVSRLIFETDIRDDDVDSSKGTELEKEDALALPAPGHVERKRCASSSEIVEESEVEEAGTSSAVDVAAGKINPSRKTKRKIDYTK